MNAAIGKMALASTIGVLFLCSQHAFGATAVTDNIISQASGAQNNVAVTFGQVFKKGDVPRGSTIVAAIDGRPVPLQVDSKATHGDGSLRHAVLSVILSSLPGKASLPMALSTQPRPKEFTQGGAVSLAQLLATEYNAKVALDIGGEIYSADARALLQRAHAANTCKPWSRDCNLWLSGPLASEWVVNGPVAAADGTPNPDLQVYFAVRAYAGATTGTIGDIRTDIIVENASAFAPQAQPRYTATLTSGTASYTSPALTQYAYTRWHKPLWWNNGEPQVYLQQDTRYIQDTLAVSRYMALKPDEKFLAGLRQTCDPLDHCDQTKRMHMTGAQAAIGPLPRWSSVYMVHPDVRAYRWMLANTDALGTYGTHFRDAQSGWPVSIQKHPNITIANWASASKVASRSNEKGTAYKADTVQNCVNNIVVSKCVAAWFNTGNPYSWDNAHQPSGAYLPYMVTGDYYYMSELAFGASFNELFSNEAYRGFSKGLIDASHRQVRGKAWVLREMADAAWLVPDEHPLRAEFTADVENSLADWNSKYTDNPGANSLGVMDDGTAYSMNGGKHNGIAPWQHNFLTWSVGHAAELGFKGADRFRDWLAKFEIGLMTDWQANPAQGFCWLQASAYNVQVKDAAGKWLPSYSAVYAASFPSLAGLPCNSPGMVAAAGKLRKKPWQPGKMSGYPESPTGFPANLQIGLAAAVDSNLPEAQTAWKLFKNRTVKPRPPQGYETYPNFAILPRSGE